MKDVMTKIFLGCWSLKAASLIFGIVSCISSGMHIMIGVYGYSIKKDDLKDNSIHNDNDETLYVLLYSLRMFATATVAWGMIGTGISALCIYGIVRTHTIYIFLYMRYIHTNIAIYSALVVGAFGALPNVLPPGINSALLFCGLISMLLIQIFTLRITKNFFQVSLHNDKWFESLDKLTSSLMNNRCFRVLIKFISIIDAMIESIMRCWSLKTRSLVLGILTLISSGIQMMVGMFGYSITKDNLKEHFILNDNELLLVLHYFLRMFAGAIFAFSVYGILTSAYCICGIIKTNPVYVHRYLQFVEVNVSIVLTLGIGACCAAMSNLSPRFYTMLFISGFPVWGFIQVYAVQIIRSFYKELLLDDKSTETLEKPPLPVEGCSDQIAEES